MPRENSVISHKARTGLTSLALLACLMLIMAVAGDSARAAGAVAGGEAYSASRTGSSAKIARPVSHSMSSGEIASRPWTPAERLQAQPAEPGSHAQGGGIATRRSGARISSSPIPAETIDDPTVPGLRMHGKLFFDLGPGPDNHYSCSATLVRSLNRNVVFTAGHCVFEAATGSQPEAWATNMEFVPAYMDGLAPFGAFPVSEMVTPLGWQRDQIETYDLAVLALQSPAEDVVGARRIDFNANLRGRSLEIFGYPAEPAPEFDGEKLIRCRPDSTGFDTAMPAPYPFGVAPCRMQRGSSGGGWILDDTYLASVVSYGHCIEGTDPLVCGTDIYGPQLGAAAINLMSSANIGGTAVPSVKVVKNPPRKIRKRKVSLKVTGDGSTPITRFKVRLDRTPAKISGSTIKVTKLSLGRHTLWIRSIDQTGRLSSKTIKRTFRVLPKKRAKKRR